jgi:hypothetical protein
MPTLNTIANANADENTNKIQRNEKVSGCCVAVMLQEKRRT